MQGTAADIIKRAMLDVDAWIESTSPPARMIMQVHDELVFEVDPAALDDVAAQIRSRMCGAANLDVVLDVDIGIGATWAAAH